MLTGTHHIAVICSDYSRSKAFYMDKLGFRLERELYRPAQNDYIRMLRLGDTVIELFDKADAPQRVTNPEALGLRHLAFRVADVEQCVAWLNSMDIPTEPIRTNPFTGKKLVFFQDPDGLPLELCEE